MKTLPNKTLAAVFTALLSLAACQHTTVALDSQIDLPAAFEHAPAAAAPTDIARWWQHWQDPVLNRLVEEALAHNHDIRIAQSRLAEARATARLAQADLGPTAGLGVQAAHLDAHIRNPADNNTRALLRRNPQTADLGARTLETDGSSAGGTLSVSWEPDIFGRKQSDADAARAAALGTQEQLYGARLLVAADVAEHYLQARAAERRLATLQQSIATTARLHRYVQGRFQAGHATAHDVRAVASRLSTLEAQPAPLQAARAAHVRSLAILGGHAPQGYTLPESKHNPLSHIPAAPQGHTPQGLLERRPDIRAHAAQVQAYAAKLASARADLLPRFSIEFLGNGSISLDSDSNLKGWGSLMRAQIQLPLFTNGRIRANIAAADARLQTALLQYDQNILTALGEVDSAYHGHHAFRQQGAQLTRAHQQAAAQADAAEKLFRHGQYTLDQALNARLTEQQAQDQLIQSQLQQAQSSVLLYKALGGGWETD